MFKNWFIKNKKLLEENSRLENLIDLSTEIERFSTKIDHIEFSSIFWFIGKFWSWKSNFLNQIKAKYTDDSKWFDFDAWKYPERWNLWESFILEIARQLDIKTFDETIKQIDWTQNDDKKTLLNIVWDIIPLLSVIKNFNHFFNTSPAKRTFEIQNILTELFEKIEEKDIYIIVEDIDRSWDNWVYFLETLNYFIKNINLKNNKKIIVIVPIWKEKYDEEKVKLSYSKCLDYNHNFSLKDVKLEKFVEDLFEDEILKNHNHKWQITSLLELIFIKYSDQIIMRSLKTILRNANQNYIALVKKHWKLVDFRLSIVFEFLKNIKIDNQNKLRNIQNWTSTIEFNWNDLFSFFIWVIISNVDCQNLITNTEYRTKEHYLFWKIPIKFNKNIECKFNEWEKNYNICIDYLDN